MKSLSRFASILLSSLLILKPGGAQSPIPAGLSELQIHVADSTRIFARSGAQPKGFTIQVTDASGSGAADAAVVVRLPDEGATGTFSDGTHAAISYTDGAGNAHFTGITWDTSATAVAIKITATRGTAHAGMLLDETVPSAAAAPAAAPTPAHAENPVASPEKLTAVTVVPAPQQPPAAPLQQPGVAQNTGRSLLPSPASTLPSEATVSVINRGKRDKGDHVDTGSHKKWIILALVIAAGAGAGIAMAGKGKSSSSSTPSPSTGVSIGSPTVSVGSPR